MPLTVFLAHSGRSLELECSPTTRVDEVQSLLTTLTGAPASDQILTHEGAPLAPTSLLSDYGLAGEHVEESSSSKDVFLYSRALLRPDGPTPPLETLPELPAAAEPPEQEQPQEQAHHPLDSASSPLLRALPEYQRQFRRQLKEAEAAADAGAARVALCCRLVNEAEVQAMAVDAAMASVEPHYAFICNAQDSFRKRFSKRFSSHQDILNTFDADVEFLHSVELPEQLHTENVSKLSDLVDLEELKAIAGDCRRSHQRFAARVQELESLHAALRADVEALFMRAPSVDLDELSHGLATAAAAADEQSTAVQVLAGDCKRADSAVEDAAAVAPSMPPGLQDIAGMLEAMHESHASTVLPRVQECTGIIEGFAQTCVSAKNSLATDALRALRTIASQQSKIREMKEALAPFPATLDRQDAQISKLLAVRRLPAAYKQALAECVRRAAFAEKYAAFASDLAERMGKFRLKEAAMRQKFREHVAGQVPEEILKKMGLDQPPPHCHVSVPGEEADLLLPVTPEDLRRLQLPRYSSITSELGAATAVGGTGEDLAVSASIKPSAPAVISPTSSLQLQNAQLRAELASQIALGCIQAAELAALGPLSSSASQTMPPPPPPAPSSPSAATMSGASSGSATSAQGGQLLLGPEAVLKFEKALAAKDAVIATVQENADRQMAALRQRIAELEAQVSGDAGPSPSSSAPSPPAAASITSGGLSSSVRSAPISEMM